MSFHPEWQTRAQQEIDSFPATPVYEDARNMKVLHAIVKETLRIFPVTTAHGRAPIKDTVFNGITVPANVGHF